MYLQKSDTTPALNRSRQVCLQQLTTAKPSFGEHAGSSCRAGSCIGGRAVAKPAFTQELLIGINSKQTLRHNTHTTKKKNLTNPNRD